MLKRIISIILALIMCVGIAPLPVRAEPMEVTLTAPPQPEQPPVTMAPAELTDAEEENQRPVFEYINVSAAGPSSANGWASGDYASKLDELMTQHAEDPDYEHMSDPEFLKCRLMIRAMDLNLFDEMNPAEYFFAPGDSGTHELNLYGYTDVDPESVSVIGVALTEPFEKREFGDGETTLYCYTGKIFVPENDTLMSIMVEGETVSNVIMTHFSGYFNAPVASTFWVESYTEGTEPGTITSVTVKLSGFSLPDAPENYCISWISDPEDWENSEIQLHASDVSEADECGYRLITFTFPENTFGPRVIWAPLTVNDGQSLFFFEEDSNIIRDDEGVIYTEAFGGTTVELPTPYYCLYQEQGEAPEVMPEVHIMNCDLLDNGYYSSQMHYAYIYQNPGSYLGGEWRYSSNGKDWHEWYYAGDRQNQFSFPFANSGEYGNYKLYAQFRKEGLRTVTLRYNINYNDGKCPAPDNPRIIVKSTGETLAAVGGKYIIGGPADREFIFAADGMSNRKVNLYFKHLEGNGGIYQTGSIFPMEYNADLKRYEVTLKHSDIPEDAIIAAFWTEEAAGYRDPSPEVELTIENREPGFIKELSDPAIDFELRKDADGLRYKAIRPSAHITGAFTAATGGDYGQRVTLAYRSEYVSEPQTYTFTPNARTAKTYDFDIEIPYDASSLISIRYELLENGRPTGDDIFYDLRDYRVYSNTNFNMFGMSEDYIGASLTFDGRSFVLTEDNYSQVSLGDIPSGEYDWELSGRSGHIAGGTVEVDRSYDTGIEPSELPELGSLTVNTVGFTSSVTGEEVNPTGSVKLTVTTPDGRTGTANGVSGQTFRDLPIDSTVSLDFTYPTTNEEISAAVPDRQSLTISGEETVTYTYKPFTLRTVTGTIWGVRTASYYTYGLVPNYNTIVLTQEVTRNGVTETVTKTAATSRAQNGRFTFTCYDDIPFTVEAHAISWDTATRTVTASGNQNLGQLTMTYGGESVIAVKAQFQTPMSVDVNGNRIYFADDSQTGSVASQFISIGHVDTDGKTLYPKDFETFVENGQLYVKLPEGFTTGDYYMSVTASGTTEVCGMTLSIPAWPNNSARVTADERGMPTVSYQAEFNGGEFRATVVDAFDEEYTGFLIFFNGDGSHCIYASGKGELTLPYGGNYVNSSNKLLSLFVADADAAGMEEVLSTSSKTIYDKLAMYDAGGWDKINFEHDFKNKLRFKTVTAYKNRYIYVDDMTPSIPITAEFLPPYFFDYKYDLTDNIDELQLTVTLTKRYPDRVDINRISSIKVFVPQDMNYRQQNNLAKEVTDLRYSVNTDARKQFTCTIPLGADIGTAFRVEMTYYSMVFNEGYITRNFYRSERVPIFTVGSPGNIYIGDQLDAQGLSNTTDKVRQASWTCRLPMRLFATSNPEENVIHIFDNGTEIKTLNLSQTGINDGTPFINGYLMGVDVVLTDNLQAGLHVVWATREYNGETMCTEPAAFSVLDGRQEHQVYVSQLLWTHWNHRLDGGKPDEMYFPTLNALAGQSIWVWPGKVHRMQFRVNNATSKELAGVTLHYTTMVWVPGGWSWYDNYGNHSNTWVEGYYKPVELDAPCRLINDYANDSIWYMDDRDLGYLVGFEFRFDYRPQILSEENATLEDLDRVETETFYKANGLGDVPDNSAFIGDMDGMSERQILDGIAAMSEADDALKAMGLTLSVKTSTNDKLEVKLDKPTDMISEYTTTMSRGEQKHAYDIYLEMEAERKAGKSLRSGEEGWDVTWAEYDTVNGSTITRIASFDGVKGNRHALLTHTTYYLTAEDAALLDDGIPTVSPARVRTGETASINAAGDNLYDPGDPDPFIKQGYDVSNTIYSAVDVVDEGWKVFLKETHLYWHPGDTEGAKAWVKDNKMLQSDKMGNAFKALGVIDTVVTYANGPAGEDPTGLRMLLSHVKDERARQSLENQIKDYEKLRYDIYKQDCTMSTLSTASSFGGELVLFWGKLALFVGGTANSIISGFSKDYNRQVYNSTLHDIQYQLKFEAIKAQHLKKSYLEAEQWLRDKMDSIYGKGNWSEYALAEERKLWVLKEYPGGVLKYVWKDKAPEYETVLDPSGYVFEGVEDNRIEGVTATIYYSETRDGSYSVWMDRTGEQANPLITTSEGAYSWMVPMGWWKVRYEKDGYIVCETKPMRVPPIHTAVNIGLVSTEAPTARIVPGDGEYTVIFSKYMQLETLVRLYGPGEDYTADSFDAAAFAVRFYDENGDPISGTVTFPDKAPNTGYTADDAYSQNVIASEWFVRTAVFTPDEDTTVSGWSYADGMASYAGVPLDTMGVPTSFLVTLDTNGGDLSVKALTTREDGTLASLPSPTREGYTFNGWYKDGELVTAETAFTADAALVAEWNTVGSYTVAAEEDDSGNLVITFSNASQETERITCVAAAYDERGKLLRTEITALTTGDSPVTIDRSGADTVKAYMLNETTGEPIISPFYFKVTA